MRCCSLCRYLEIFERTDWCNLIVLSTVLAEFNQRASARAFHRLAQLRQDARRAVVVFPNDRCAATWVRRRTDENRATYVRECP